ncbi:DUF2711 domain-containing protein [Bacillus pacificus]|uniref:DUF2711 family protein n=1 Tax=Bacillus cereus group TaxID=86661 RepID=UPI00065BC24F|nr:MULTISPECIES: DUF2711 family protein [Bacillus cereus group]KMP80417.1 hypothetical protein TU63_28385 [Bacillus cereus]MCU5256384.1 DUF2711 domain-containing protein [Bacillus pacificus]USL05353.1 DUF2711 domain-containing protein [Bacillus anthracis]WCA21736.1 DUF2711 family protein [Bacillus paranthracis]
MLDYIWFDDKTPILNQLPNNFKSAAILFHPFVQMPLGWEQTRQINSSQHIYTCDEEILKLGIPVKWDKMISNCGLTNHQELAIALKTSIGALREKYSRADFADKLNSKLKPDLYYPTEDSTSVFLISDILKILGSKGANHLYFSAPVMDNAGVLKINDITLLDICDLSPNELILTDENMDFAFMSIFDSFITLFLAKDENINHIVQLMDLEAIICDKKTYIDWYFN